MLGWLLLFRIITGLSGLIDVRTNRVRINEVYYFYE